MIVKVISLALLLSAVAAQGNETCTEGATRVVKDNCRFYGLCINGDWTVANCGEDLMWSDAKGYCLAQDQPCANSCDGVVEGTFRSDVNDCEAFETCYNGEWKSQHCARGRIFSRELNACIVNDGSCPKARCKPGEFNKIGECNRDFQICCDGKWIDNTCPLSLVFDSSENFCVSPESCKGNTPKPIPCGDIAQGEFRSIPGNCTGFEFCSQGKWVPTNCPEGMKWGDRIGYCINNADAECKDPRNNCDGVEEGSFRKDVDDCSGFEFCYNKKWIKKQCVPGMMFDDEIGFCVKDHGSCKLVCTAGQLKAKDSFNCAPEFLRCSDNEWVELKCPANMVFDPKKQFCVKPENCSIDCGGIAEGTSRSIDDNCEAFEICNRGEWVQESCPPGKMWSSNYSYCIEKDYTCKPCKGAPEGSLRPRSHCGRDYFMCLRNFNIVQTCPIDMIFDHALLFCTDVSKECGGDEVTNCGNDIQGTLKPVEGKCTKYDQCYRTRWLEEECSDGLMFDDKTSQCVQNDGSCKPCIC